VSKDFPRQWRRYLRLTLGVGAALLLLSVAGTAYYGTPKYWRVAYEPIQPIRFSHKLHAGALGMNCLYCHNHVGESPHSNVPSPDTCLNCHGEKRGNIRALAPAFAPLRAAAATGRPIGWARVHRVPDYAYFNHAVHVRRGVSCVSCHGKVNEMEVVRHVEPLSMAWCLDCHRNPAPHLRPADAVTDLDWSAETDPRFRDRSRGAFVDHLLREAGINPPENCSGCHR
jgi:hypothetical protein